MFGERYQGVRIAVTNAAMQELMDEGFTLFDIVEILETGMTHHEKEKKEQSKNGLIEGRKHTTS